VWNRLVAGALCALLASACGGDSMQSQASLSQPVSYPASLVQLLEASVAAPWTTTFSGVRRIEALTTGDGGAPQMLVYREAVAGDGTGRFSIVPLDVLSFVPDPTGFQALQKTREGFLYRYRDFAIRDLGALFANYQVIDLDQEVVIAGRTCRSLEFRRADGSGSVYRAALDAATGLVLRAEESSPEGLPLGLMEFESYSATPDLGGIAWFTPDPPELPLPIHGLDEAAGFDVLEPSLLPAGYQPWKAATLVDDEGHRWLKQTFTDGVEPLFFLHRDGAPQAVVTPPPGGPSGAVGTASAAAGASGVSNDELWVYPIGRLTAIEGVLREREVIALGKVDSEELLDLLEFSVD
jgi:hypothetical protein